MWLWVSSSPVGVPERDCAKEWDKRRLARFCSSVDGEEFGREGVCRVGRFGCMEMYVGEFDDDPPSESTLTEDWEEYVGGAPPADLLKQGKLDNSLMRIGKRRVMKDRGKKEKEESAMAETSGPTLRMMSKGKRSTNTKKKRQERHFFERGERGGLGHRTPDYFW